MIGSRTRSPQRRIAPTVMCNRSDIKMSIGIVTSSTLGIQFKINDINSLHRQSNNSISIQIMGLIDIFKRKSKLIDEVFGELEYSKFSDKESNFYNGTITFDAQQVGINLNADNFGPTKEQKAFYQELCAKYPNLKRDVITPFLNKELEDWREEAIVDFDNEFTIDGISLPIISGKHIDWSLTLYSSKIKHWVTIEFIDWQPQEGVIVDG